MDSANVVSFALLSGQQALGRACAAAATIYAYDILITIGMEANLFWSRLSLDLLSILYICNRYICFVLFINAMYYYKPGPGYCYNILYPLGEELGRVCWTGIMTMRTWALWRQDKVVSKLLCITGPAFAVIAIAFVPFVYLERARWKEWDSQAGVCISTGKPASWVMAPIILSVLYVAWLTVLTTLRCVQYARFSLGGASFFSSQIIRAIMRDGLQYYLIAMVSTLSCLITSRFAPHYVVRSIVNLSWVITSVSISRFVLNLRKLAKDSLDEQQYAITHESGKPTLRFNVFQSSGQTICCSAVTEVDISLHSEA
ncbi:hypothetical protein CPB86DRAFT_787708 [Serendipita vermifera]|nr:hypothetical protein CPB86DRAFT_787708 [Serendipita vermifera]